MFMSGVTGPNRCWGGETGHAVRAAAGLQAGDQVLTAGVRITPTWDALALALLSGARENGRIDLRVHTAQGDHSVTLLIGSQEALVLSGRIFQERRSRDLGGPSAPRSSTNSWNGAAQRAGLQAGDRILAVAGQQISDWTQWVEWGAGPSGQALTQ